MRWSSSSTLELSHVNAQPVANIATFLLSSPIMLLTFLLSSLLSSTSAVSLLSPQPSPQHIFSNPPEHEHASYKIPSIHESTVLARRILHLSTIGTLVTSFPSTTPSSTPNNDQETIYENRPADVANSPIGLMEYYADCEPETGNPTLLAIGLATPFKNYGAGSNISLSVRWWPKQTMSYLSSSTNAFDDDPEIPTPHTPAALPRFSLHGHLEPISASDLAKKLIPACFLQQHPDSILWQPGNEISHESEYVRFVVEEVYWFGGFGDRARIGWLPIEEWRNVSMEEVAAARLPGEHKKSSGERSWWRGWL